MIRLESEQLIPLKDVPLLDILPVRRAGKRLSLCTLYRWANQGLRGRRLETLKIGGQRCTSIPALQRFFHECAGVKASDTPTQAPQSTKVLTPKAVEEALDKLGI